MNIHLKYAEALCQCPNQHLLTPGLTCEVCGCLTPEGEAQDERGTYFDADFFEALDAWLEMADHAA